MNFNMHVKRKMVKSVASLAGFFLVASWNMQWLEVMVWLDDNVLIAIVFGDANASIYLCYQQELFNVSTY